MSKPYPNWRVDTLINGQSSIDSSWTASDFLDLALAACDQGGMGEGAQRSLAVLLDEFRPQCPHVADGEQCDLLEGHAGRHTFRCDDGGCCEPTDADLDLSGEGAAARAHALDIELRAAGEALAMATNRKPISIPVVGTDIDVGRVAAVMNLLAANLSAPMPVSMSFWASDYPDAEIAFRAFAAQHPRDVVIDERQGAIYLISVINGKHRGLSTFYRREAEERIERERIERDAQAEAAS